MSNKITPSELRDRLSDAFPDHGAVTDGTLTHIARALGYELEPERPEPGTWHLTDDGRTAVVGLSGSLHTIHHDGECIILRDPSKWPNLTPARVVPAEKAETPSWHQVMEAIRDARSSLKFGENVPYKLADAVMALLEGGNK